MEFQPTTHNLEQTLTAATLVAASLAVLFVLWQADVIKALGQVPNSGGNDNDKPACAEVRGVLFLKSAPLLLTTLVTFAILVHQVWPILREATQCYGMSCHLDEVKALSLVNTAIVGLLGLGLLGQFWSLCRQWRRLGGMTGVFPKKTPK